MKFVFPETSPTDVYHKGFCYGEEMMLQVALYWIRWQDVLQSGKHWADRDDTIIRLGGDNLFIYNKGYNE